MRTSSSRLTTALLATALASVAAAGPLDTGGGLAGDGDAPAATPDVFRAPVTTITDVVDDLVGTPPAPVPDPPTPDPDLGGSTESTGPEAFVEDVLPSEDPSPEPSPEPAPEPAEPADPFAELLEELRAVHANVDLDLLQLDELGVGRVVVKYADGEVPGDVLTGLDPLVGELAVRLGVELDETLVRGIELPTIGALALTAPTAVIAAVLTDERVEAFHQQRRVALDLYASRAQINAEDADQPASYEQTVGDRTVDRTRPGVTGAGVVVGVLDSGINAAHPDLANTTTGLHFSFGELQQVLGVSAEEWDAYVEGTGSVALQDEIGHGTHVASTIGGTGALAADTGGPDLSGVAPAVEFVSLKITTAPLGIVEDLDFEESALAAFDYVLRHPELGIDLLNNSWGLLPTEPNCLGLGCFGLGEETDFDAAAALADAVVAAGIDVVFSAGNDGPPEEDGVGTIGGHVGDATIAVAAGCKTVDSGCEEGQTITDFSSRGNADGTGRQVDVTAPGDQIMAALSPSVLTPLTECATTQHPGYFCISGTSMSAPHVAGVAALLREANPGITTAQLKGCIVDTATPLANATVHDAGSGMVETEAALQCAHALTSPPPARETQDPSPLAMTGGGAALGGIALMAAARKLRGRREDDEDGPGGFDLGRLLD